MAAPVTYTSGYSSPWFGGVAVADSTIVPNTYNVAINGRPYLLNTDPQAIESYGDNFKEESLPLLRTQADQSKLTSEQSISPQQFWRRSQESWHKGAGQSVLDRDTSDPARFSSSKGVDPWTRYQLGLLKVTTSFRTTANTNLFTVSTSNGYYLADGQQLYSGSNFAAPALVTGTPAAAVTGLTATGGLGYAGFGTSGIYGLNGTVATSYVTGTVNRVGFVKGRLLTGFNGALYNPVAGGALPAAFYTQPDTGWSWTAFAEGNANIYASGFTGNRSRIYRIAVQPDGTALGIPVVAASLPTNEIVRSMLGYLGFIVIGTDKGVRFATAESTGDLTLGALIPTPGAVEALDANGHFVWFGWTNYDSVSSGLGRFDLTTINEGLAPAYASDLMATTQGAVQGIVVVDGRHGFSVSGVGFFAESATNYVASGTLVTGQITYGIADPKVAVLVDLKHQPLATSNSVALAASYDRATATSLGSSAAAGSVSPSSPLSAGKRRTEEIELTFTLTSNTTTAPTLNRWTLLSYPAPVGASLYTLPLILAPRIVNLRDVEDTMDPLTEYQFLIGLHATREICTVQVGQDSFEGTLEDYVWLPNAHTWDRGWWAGTFIAKLRKITG